MATLFIYATPKLNYDIHLPPREIHLNHRLISKYVKLKMAYPYELVYFSRIQQRYRNHVPTQGTIPDPRPCLRRETHLRFLSQPASPAHQTNAMRSSGLRDAM